MRAWSWLIYLEVSDGASLDDDDAEVDAHEAAEAQSKVKVVSQEK